MHPITFLRFHLLLILFVLVTVNNYTENMHIKNVIIYVSCKTTRKTREVITIKLRKTVTFIQREQLVIKGSRRDVSEYWQYFFLAQMVALWVDYFFLINHIISHLWFPDFLCFISQKYMYGKKKRLKKDD